jgi:outer membrane protein assembly factor BamB
VILGNRLFLTAASGPRQERLHVLCLDTRTGSPLWERRFWATGRTQCHEKTSVATPSPAAEGNRLYVTFSSNDVICLDLDGNLIWLRGITLDYPNASNSLGMASSLVIVGSTLVVMVENDSESLTVGLDCALGANRWKLNRPKLANWTSPIPLPPTADALAVGIQSGQGLLAVNAANGQPLWEYADGAATIPSSVVCEDVVYVPSHGLTALKLDPSGDPPEQIWRSGRLRPATASPVVVADRALVINAAGVLTCGSTADGARLWQLRLKGPFSATPVASGHRLYCLNEAGLLYVVGGLGQTGEVLSTYNLDEPILSTPAIAHGSLYVRSDRHLWKLN